MADTTTIEWTDATWNPITGCTIVDAGCTNCYAMALAGSRLRNHPSRAGLTRVTGGRAKWTGEVRLNEQWLDQPLKWTRPRMIFVCAHGDLFHESVPDEWIDRVFAVMALCPQHTFQVLTKRPDRARAYLQSGSEFSIGQEAYAISTTDAQRGQLEAFGNEEEPNITPKTWPLPNVWLGTSASDQASADKRIPELLACPVAVRFVSLEPLLGPVDLTRWSGIEGDGGSMGFGLDWVIVGGESGTHARSMHPDWARGVRDQCVAAGVAFFFKQWGGWAPFDVMQADDLPQLRVRASVARGQTELAHLFDDRTQMGRIGKKAAGRQLDGRTWDQMPGGLA